MALTKVQSDLLGTGSVLQVVQGTLAGSISTSSSTFVTTGLSASITPKSSSSKILILVNMADVYTNNPGFVSCITVFRGSTNLSSGSGYSQAFSYIYGAQPIQVNASFSVIDSPATTSSTTYSVQWTSISGTTYININGQTSYIQLLEIAA